MADNPTLSAYSVALFFEGQVALATIIAGSEAEAVAQVSVQIARQHDKPLVGIGVMRLEEEWMRFALKTLESGEPHRAPVVSLVSDNLRPAMIGDPGRPPTAEETRAQMALADNLWPHGTCPRHRWQGLAWEACPHCQNRAAYPLPTEAPDPA